MTLFEIIHKDKYSNARTGVIHTDHGDIHTPMFMPVGTQATVKTLDTNDLHNIDAQIILSNTYHLHLRPGEDLIEKTGGLHKFMGWDKPILTDSGGFQVFSLGTQKKQNKQKNYSHEKLVLIDDDGVTFHSHIDGSKHRFTPEIAIDIQHKLGADIIMAFDECTPDSAKKEYTKKALSRTHDWAKRSLATHKKNTDYYGYHQFLFGIIQGAGYEDLRKQSAKFISSLSFDGIAIGGESIGYNMTATKNILEWIMPIIPKDKPQYTMGVGYVPMDLFTVIEQGIDMFDCVAPSRIARNGTLYVSPLSGERKTKYTINIFNAKFREDWQAIDKTCSCFTCTHHSRAYLHHLFVTGELLAYRLATLHNLTFFIHLMKQIQQAIQDDTFLDLKKDWEI